MGGIAQLVSIILFQFSNFKGCKGKNKDVSILYLFIGKGRHTPILDISNFGCK